MSYATYTEEIAHLSLTLSQAGAAEVRASEQDALNATLEAKVS